MSTRRKSWRKSLGTFGTGLARGMGPASASASASPRKGKLSKAVKRELSKSKRIVNHTGVSVGWLVGFWGDVKSGAVAGDVKLVVAKEQLADDVWAGRTINANGRVPYRKSGELQAFTAEQVTEKPREEWTISDVCDYVIIPSVMARKCFFTDTLAKQHVGKPFQGAFVSQARSSPFADLIAALTRHFTKDGAQAIPADAFVWLDLFCANQPLLTQQEAGATDAVMKERADLLTRGFHLAIEQFDERLFFFNSWLAPAALTRMWCIWEVYGAIKSGEKMTVIFAPGEEDKFVDVIMDGPRKIAQHIASMRPEQAQCFDADDLAMITTAVETTVGWPKVKKMVMEQLTSWMLLETEAAVKRAATESGSDASEDFARLLHHSAIFLKANGQLDVARSYLDKAVVVYEGLFGTEDAGKLKDTVAPALDSIAGILHRQGKLDESLAMQQRVLDIEVTAAGTEMHPAAIDTMSNMASLLKVQGKLDEALHLYEKCLGLEEGLAAALSESGTETVGRATRVAVTLYNMGNLLRVQKKFDEALEAYQRSIDIEAEETGETPSVAQTMMGMANVLQDQGGEDALVKALDLYKRSLDISVAAYGTDEQADVAVAYVNLGTLLKKLNRKADALENVEHALRIFEATVPPDHPFIAKAKALAQDISDAM